MYNNPVAPSLAMTGLALTGGNVFWWFLAAFALIAAGTAIMRIVPRRTHPADLTHPRNDR